MGLTIAGLAVFGAGYVGSAASYALNSEVIEPTLLIPVAGPWIAVTTTDWNAQVGGDLNQAIVVVQGLLQATGLVLLTIGISRGASETTDRPSVRGTRFGLLVVPSGALGSVWGTL